MKKIVLFFVLLFAVSFVFAQKTTTSANVLIAKDKLKVGGTTIKQIDTTLALPSHDGVPTTAAVVNALSGIGGQNFANADLTATGDRTHDFGLNDLSILKTDGIENYGIALTNAAFMYSHNVGTNSTGSLSSSGGAAKMQAYGNIFLGFKTFEVNKDAFIFNQYGVNNTGKLMIIEDSLGKVKFLDKDSLGLNISNSDLTMQANHTLNGNSKVLYFQNFKNLGLSAETTEINAGSELNFASGDVMNLQSAGSINLAAGYTNISGNLHLNTGQNNTGKILTILNPFGTVGYVSPPSVQNIGTHDLTLTGNRNLFLANNQFTISNSHKFSMGNNWAAFNFLGSDDGLGIESNANVVLRARDVGKRISFDSPNIYFHDVMGVDNTGKVLTILNSAGKLGYATQSAGGLANIIGGEGVTVTNSNVINLGGTVSNTRNLDMGTAGALVLKNVQNSATPERDVLVLTNDANPISGGDGENVGIKFDVANNITRLAASDKETQLKANKPIYIEKLPNGSFGGSYIVVGSGDMALFTTTSTGQELANLSISGTSISSLNYGSSRNDAGNPTSIASFDVNGTLQRHEISELATSFSGDFWKTTGNAGMNPTNNFIGTTDNQPLAVRTNNVTNLFVAANGNVGIGNGQNTPASKLDVNGAVKCTDFRLQSASAGAGKYLQSNQFGDATWATIAAVTVGDTKYGYQTADHNGWLRLDGRSISTLTAAQQAAAATLGFAGIIPNTANRYPKAANGTVGVFGGSQTGTTTLTANNIPLLALPNATVQVAAYTSPQTPNIYGQIEQGGGFLGLPSYYTYPVNYTNPNVGSSSPTAISIPVDPTYVSLNHFIYLGN